MHNIDRTVGESNYEFNNESYEFNNEFAQEDEFLNELNGTSGETYEYQGELPGEYSHESYESNYETGQLSGEALEMELATELLGVSNEQELEQFLGSLVRRVGSGIKTFANSSAGKAIGGFLKAAAKKALPIVGRAAGAYFGGPIGSTIGGKLGDFASNLFELELEGLSNEDKEFEMSRAYVRFANAAVRNAMRNPSVNSNPKQAARAAVIGAAKRYAPGLLRRRPAYNRTQIARPGMGYQAVSNTYNDNQGYDEGQQQQGSGTWYREGNQIILNL